jgi:hypothetical protein
MKKYLLILSLLLSTTMFSSLAFGEWELLVADSDGEEIYWDRDKVRVNQGLVYWYLLVNYLKPSETGTLSATKYQESDCQRMSVLDLSTSFYKQAMAEGQAWGTRTSPNPEVSYPPPSSSNGIVLKRVCDYVNLN